ncbi:Ribosomal protein S12 methylthiotransferase RimO [Sedimentisphaera cyanobacteriorum]|uniref:Ribosomal protein uS12 methylthiotransferase RimO n=1 Tax=Sedimentisphaera cyanobacteriorum TaxID=1940790 RepID=A0A1Q2HMX9_9BACT|nr:30S ribosomal protein S12 methylthiotransferase RimO [Sedimentisphaera cyanobacteriorum]AQQ08615.1 Ribosomal protein S12 methylthiotransferase RimO [Sedimentisphaera cyanobacteriorum]
MAKNYTVTFVSLGCPKNTVDTEVMLADMAERGFILDSSSENTDFYIVNTCGFIEPAKQEAFEELRQGIELKKQGKVRFVAAAGCLVERMGRELAEALPEIDCLISLCERDKAGELLLKTAKSKGSRKIDTASGKKFVSNDSVRLLTTSPGSAYLRISEGCGRGCSFCTIPAIRGPFRSKPKAEIIREAQVLSENGVREVNLIAQDTTGYGKDIGLEDGLCELLEELAKTDLEWIRILYLYPASVSDKLLDTIASHKKILNYIDMPIQHIDNELLKSMRRTDTEEKTAELIEKIRAKLDKPVLRTTVISGYPGETEEKHNKLLKFIKWAEFDALGAFAFCPEKDTPAGRMDNQLPEEIKQKRVGQIMRAQQEIAFRKNRNMQGKKLTLLTEGFCEDYTQARYYGQAPEIDSVCAVPEKQIEPGKFIEAEVADTSDYDLICRLI